MTYYELRKNILLKLDEYESDYDTVEHNYAMTDDEDILTKLPYFINEAIRFAFYGKSYKEKWVINQGVSFNSLTETEAEHRTEDVIFSANSAYGYYFEVDDDATVKIETSPDGENWSLDETINIVTDKSKRCVVSKKGIKGSGQYLRLVFTGNYYYRIFNVSIYNVLFSSVERIPEYNGYRTYPIPSGLYRVETVYKLGKEKKSVQFKVKEDMLYLPDEDGEYEIESSYFPDPVSSTTPNNTELNIPKDIEYVVVQKACAFLSQEGEYEEFISDSEQGMQMIDTNRGASAPTVKRFW